MVSPHILIPRISDSQNAGYPGSLDAWQSKRGEGKCPFQRSRADNSDDAAVSLGYRGIVATFEVVGRSKIGTKIEENSEIFTTSVLERCLHCHHPHRRVVSVWSFPPTLWNEMFYARNNFLIQTPTSFVSFKLS